mgnify:CR=1 FL=1
MKCLEAQQSLGTYWDLPEHDPLRMQIEQHLAACDLCSAEFAVWKESRDLVRIASREEHAPMSQQKKETPVSMSVMDRIYQDESWRMPVNERSYRWSARMRRNLSGIIAFCLALFIVSFFASIFETGPSEEVVMYGLKAPATAIAETDDGALSEDGEPDALKLLVASISEPTAIRVEAVPKDPNYYVAFSLLGLITALLIMNWLSRVRI